ncbi:hypothetical protein ES703_113877 [subsurface metagenome]
MLYIQIGRHYIGEPPDPDRSGDTSAYNRPISRTLAKRRGSDDGFNEGMIVSPMSWIPHNTALTLIGSSGNLLRTSALKGSIKRG